MLIKSNNRWDAAKALHNTLLKDKTRYCNNCGKTFNIVKDDDGKVFACCEEPLIGTHLAFVKAIKEQNTEISKTILNDFAASKQKNMRWGVSIPPRFLAELELGFKNTYNENLFRTDHPEDLTNFMKTFKHFTVCNKI